MGDTGDRVHRKNVMLNPRRCCDELLNPPGARGSVFRRHRQEEPSDRRRHVLETIPRVPVDPRQAIRSELSWLLHGRHTYKSVLTTCRSLCVEANNHAANLCLETAVASEPLTLEQTEAAAIKMAQWVWSQREKNPPKQPQGNRQRSQKPQR